MTNHSRTKNALIASLLSVVMCISMLVSSTFAWFTDSASTGVNKIVAGNLDIAVFEGQVAGGSITYSDQIDTDTKLFDDAVLWEPGHTQVAYLKVENKGTLALKYNFNINVVNEREGKNAAGEPIELSKVLQFKVTELTAAEFFATREDAIAATALAGKAGALASTTVSDSMLAGGPAKYYALVVWMPTGTNNDANHNGTDIPSIQLGVNVVAAQLNQENDSFGNDYDLDASYPASAGFRYDKTNGSNGQDGGLTVSVPAGANLTDENGAAIPDGTELVLSVEPTATNPNVVVNDGETAETYEISLKTLDGKKVTSDKEMAIDLPIGAGRVADFTLYHNETVIDSTYNIGTGILSFKTKNFSPFTVVENATLSESTARALLDKGGVVDFKGAVMYNDKNDINYGANLREYTFKAGTTVKNLVLTGRSGATRWLHSEGDVTFENCVFEAGAVYAAHFDSGKGTITFKNCTLSGWSSFGRSFDKVVFENCTFDEAVNNDSWGLLRFYCDGAITNCTFLEDFDRIDNAEAGITITIDGCTGHEGKMFCNGDPATLGATWIVDGEDISASIT